MNFYYMISSFPHRLRTPNLSSSSWHHNVLQHTTTEYCSISNTYTQLGWIGSRQSCKISEENIIKRNIKIKKLLVIKSSNHEERLPVAKKGSVAGAVALIIGTSIGSGILALPNKTSPAGLVPSLITMTLCWAFLLIEALLLVEINVRLMRLRKKKIKVVEDDDEELEIISIRTMAEETLGERGGTLASVTYVFLGYTSMIAYCTKSGDILYHLTNLSQSITGVLFTTLFGILISVGGTRATDQVNQWLTASMIGLLITIEVIAVVFGRWSGLESGDSDWEKVPGTLPVMIFTLVYHDLAPVLCAYLGGDLTRIRTSVLLGSLVPLTALLIWEAIALNLSNQADQVSDPVELLMSVGWGGFSFMVEAFALLAVATSLIGTLLSFSEFFKEQLNNLGYDSASAQSVEKSKSFYDNGNWWRKNKLNLTATVVVVAPSLLVSTLVPDAFYAATDIAGGYCMTMLYGVLPPAMALAMIKQEGQKTEASSTAISNNAEPALLCVGLFACGIVLQQILQDISLLHN